MFKNVSLPDHVDRYFTETSHSKEVQTSRQLFTASPEDVDIKTELSIEEIVLINKLIFNNKLLKRKHLKPIYADFIEQYMRLKISLARGSRREFVDMNRAQNKPEDLLNQASSLSNILGAKK